jgi:NDP-sugar pyrophosphorylase family protein
MTLLLMAAGSGSRYGKLKQFDGLGPKEEFLLEYSIFDAIANGFDHIVVITKEANREFLEEYLSERIPSTIKLNVLVQDINNLPKNTVLNTERIKPWGTAHAVWCAKDVIEGEFVIINADDYYGKKAFENAAKFIKSMGSNNTYGIVGYSLKDTLSDHGSVSRGVCNVDNEQLISIQEHTKIVAVNDIIIDEDLNTELDPETIVSMNFWICNPSIFDYIETYFTNFLNVQENLEKNEIDLPFVAEEMMVNGLININVIASKSDWFGVTYYEDKAEAVSTLKRLTEQNEYPSPLWK